MFPRSPPVSFPFRVSPQHPLVSSLVFRGNSVEISWFGPKSAKSAKYTGVFCRFPRFRLRFCPRPAHRHREKEELSKEHKKHLTSFPGNFRNQSRGTLSFPFWFRKHGYIQERLAGAVGEGATPCTDGRPSENTPAWIASHQSSLPTSERESFNKQKPSVVRKRNTRPTRARLGVDWANL